MLKIKDNVDLKELEKYGFEKLDNNYRKHKYSWKRLLGNDSYYELYVNVDNELHICIVGNSYCWELRIVHKLQDLLYDLIQAGLVEKVGE